VFVLDAADGRLVDSLSLDPRPGEVDEPHGLAVSPDGRHWYVTVSHGEPTLWKFEADGDRRVGRLTLSIPGSGRVGISPDGSTAVIPDYWRTGQGADSEVALVSLHELVEESTAVVCPAPHDAQYDPSGSRVAITCSLSDEIVVVDAETLAVQARFPVDPRPGPPGHPRFKPLNLVWARDGGSIIATMNLSNEVRAFRPDGTETARASVGAMPTQIALTPDGAATVVVNRMGGSLSVLDTGSLLEAGRIPLPNAPHPHGVALDPGGRVAFVSFEGTVEGSGGAVAVDLTTGELLWKTEAGAYTLGIAYRAEH
jgi:DNA-binding beta-propeller fold protein YncE